VLRHSFWFRANTADDVLFHRRKRKWEKRWRRMHIEDLRDWYDAILEAERRLDQGVSNLQSAAKEVRDRSLMALIGFPYGSESDRVRNRARQWDHARGQVTALRGIVERVYYQRLREGGDTTLDFHGWAKSEREQRAMVSGDPAP
jgi:hypothetical protein